MKEFLEQLNDKIAPITRAWTDVEIQIITVDTIQSENPNEMIATVTVKVKKRRGLQRSSVPDRRNRTNAVAEEKPKRGLI